MENKKTFIKQSVQWIIGIIIIILVIIFYHTVPMLNALMIFHPTVVDKRQYRDVNKMTKNFEPITFRNTQGNRLYGGLINSLRPPSWNDTIILYSHGNGGWIGSIIESAQVKMMSRHASVFIYDYRGYGASEGSPTELGLYDDLNSAWLYLTEHKQIDPSRIIIYGHSLGTSISSYHVKKFLSIATCPRALILEAPFTSVRDMAAIISPCLVPFVVYDLNNLDNLIVVNKNNCVPVYIMHSMDDEIISYSHCLKIKQSVRCTALDIDGTHNVSVYGENVDDLFHALTQPLLGL
jgi:fermentation-respiration switch protein FrsA (DUF1100 family)